MIYASDIKETVRSKLLQYGASAVTAEELLMLLFSYAFEKTETENISLLSELLSEYPTLEQCFNAARDTAFCRRFGERVSRFFSLCEEVAGLYRKEWIIGATACKDAEDFARLFTEAYRYIDKEATLLLLLDNRMRALAVEYVSDGSFASAAFRPDTVIRKALLRHASAAVIAVNRKKGIAVPTKEELHALGYLKSSMEKAGIPLLSGILVAGDRHAVLSISENKAVKPLSDTELMAFVAAEEGLSLPEKDEIRRDMQNTLLSVLSYASPKEAERVLLGLLRRGFDLKRALSSKIAELLASDGMTKDCAALLVALGESLRRVNSLGNHRGKPMDELSAALLVRELSEGLLEESVYLLLLDESRRLVAIETLGYGVANAAAILPRRLLELAVYHGASSAYLLHTHPNGISTPSIQDIAVTRSLEQTFSAASCPLLEHIVVAEKSYTPILSYMKEKETEE